MSDVSAVVLSIGEPFLPRAVHALSAQTYPLADIVLVEHVSPFFRALNQGAARVATPFFLQVDADMILDPTCVATFRAAIEDDIGVVCGDLRDTLMGQVEGIKLFRTEVVRSVPYADTVSQDTDFIEAMHRAGWRLKYVGHADPDSFDANQTYGEHRPEYSPGYTFQKFLMEGRKYRYRGARPGLFSKLEGLERSPHVLARFARLVLAHGFFSDADRDELKPRTDDPRAQALVDLLAATNEKRAVAERLFPLTRHTRLRDSFAAFAAAGRELAEHGAGQSILATLEQLHGVRRNWPALVALLGLGHGLLAPRIDSSSLARDQAVLEEFIFLGIGRSGSVHGRARAHLENVYHRLPARLVPNRVTPWWRRVPPW